MFGTLTRRLPSHPGHPWAANRNRLEGTGSLGTNRSYPRSPEGVGEPDPIGKPGAAETWLNPVLHSYQAISPDGRPPGAALGADTEALRTTSADGRQARSWSPSQSPCTSPKALSKWCPRRRLHPGPRRSLRRRRELLAADGGGLRACQAPAILKNRDSIPRLCPSHAALTAASAPLWAPLIRYDRPVTVIRIG